ncbi:MAG: hypothetical protein F6K58_10455 [Symploca sp. SIO2E9]|nr:hypothetical protein [Symploca sp. SIO2E9]
MSNLKKDRNIVSAVREGRLLLGKDGVFTKHALEQAAESELDNHLIDDKLKAKNR